MNDYSILHLIIHAKSSIKFNTVLERSDRLLEDDVMEKSLQLLQTEQEETAENNRCAQSYIPEPEADKIA